jgi:hypothetical protein
VTAPSRQAGGGEYGRWGCCSLEYVACRRDGDAGGVNVEAGWGLRTSEAAEAEVAAAVIIIIGGS